jgi:hypothetical protein
LKKQVKVIPAKFVQVHITAPPEDVKKWKEYKKLKYNGAPAFSMMMRKAMDLLMTTYP